mmetsp:Transcript_75519/g.125926  ORF Transcript_75519/g.125926 Transcript_75519/m.125926 type:complete len:280 (+) Transcript_75519:124-963(+)
MRWPRLVRQRFLGVVRAMPWQRPPLPACTPEPAAFSPALCLAAFLLQWALVTLGNSGKLGLTNVEMSDKYPSYVTPAKWAFAIWGVIYLWEIIAMIYLFVDPNHAPLASVQTYWLVLNAAQGAWALFFTRELLALSSVALTTIAVAAVALCAGLDASDGWRYWLGAAPFWLHSGWVTAASLVGWNMLLMSLKPSSTPVLLACGGASAYFALSVGLATLIQFSTLALPMALSLAWALASISKNTKTEICRENSIGLQALQLTAGGCSVLLVAACIATFAS